MISLDAIDVFSGTGGISKALHDIVTTIQYCEVHPYCQQVLFERMKEGKLHPAPVHSDIKTLRISPRVQPTMIMGGFPCQDISTLGLKQGIANGTRSGLFHEIIRIIDECPSIQIVFLENVGNILKCGIKDVIESLTIRGFNLQWTIRTASSFGAPHVRSRWFCLAVRGNPDLSHINYAQNTDNNWLNPPSPIYTFKPCYKEDPAFDTNWTLRCQCLGNAVVPHVVRYAFIELLESYKRWDAISDCLSQCGEKIKESFPNSALIYNHKLYAIPQSSHDDINNSFPLSVKFNDKTIAFQHLPTPRRGITHASSLTERSLRDLPTVLLYSDVCKTQLEENSESITDGNLHSKMITNVNFIEWMMGYENDWTKIAPLAQSPGMHDPPSDSDDNSEERVAEVRAARPKVKALNGMHILMREHKGKSIKQVSDIWKELSEDEKIKYKEIAKLQREST